MPTGLPSGPSTGAAIGSEFVVADTHRSTTKVVNTVVVGRGGSTGAHLTGHNTDVVGVARALAGAGVTTRRRGRTMSFLRQSAEELRRVQWPDRRQTGQGTAVTLGFVVVAGAYLGALDALWNPLIQWIL